jgi:ABC-2 type transport system ATP-binding protein
MVGEADRREGTDDAVILASDIEKTYESWLPFTRSVEVLDGSSMCIDPGEIVGIVGQNGSGKSTLIKILVGVLDKDAGEIERSGTVGWCPQEPQLYERLTIDETFELFGQAYWLDDDAIESSLTDLADRLDFERFRDRQIRNLSVGNRQKVNLSVALMHEPDLLLLDDPYTGFDWDTYLAFSELSEELVDDGIGIGIISHFINDRERFDEVCELRDGSLYADSAT